MRQIRGAEVSQLRTHPTLSISRLAALTGYEAPRVTEAVAALHRDRIVTATKRALDGDRAGRVGLPR